MSKKTTVAKPATAENEVVVPDATPAVPKSPSVLKDLAVQLRCDPKQLYKILRTTCFRACRRDEEFITACMVARTYNLDPLAKQIYAYPANGMIVPIVSVDGWTRIINSQPQFDGIEFEYGGEVEGHGDGTLWCKAIIYHKDRAHPTSVTEYYNECYRETDPWNNMPRRMLRNKALIQCGRVAFGLSGIYDLDEGNDILSREGKTVTKSGEFIDITPMTPPTADDGKVFPDEPDPTEDAIPARDPNESQGAEGDFDGDDEDMPW